MNDVLKEWGRKLSYLPRVLSIAFVMSTIWAFWGVIFGIVGMSVLGLPARYPESNQFWLVFIAVSLILGSLLCFCFFRDILPTEHRRYPDQTNASKVVSMLGVLILTHEVLYPSGGTGIAVNVLGTSFLCILVSLAFFFSFFGMKRSSRGSGNSTS